MARGKGINRADYTTVWLRKTTAARLRAAAEQLVKAAEAGTVRGLEISAEQINPRACGLSLDALLTLLLDQRDAHQRRAREQQQARRRKMPEVEGEV